MWNPFKAIGGAIAKAGGAIGKALGGGLSKAGGAMSKAGDKLAGKSPAPKAPPVAPKAPPAKAPGVRTTIPVEKPKAPPAPSGGKILPPSMVPGGGTSSGMARDDAILGADSDAVRELIDAIKDFEADNSLAGLSREARDFLEHPSIGAILDKYVPGGGFAPEQWEAGMKDARNFRITRAGDSIEIIFDADFDIDGDSGEIGGRSPYATF